MPIIGNLWLFVILNETSLCEPLWFWDIKETQNCYIWKKILSHHGDSTWHTQPIQPKYGRILWLGTTSPPIWLKISFHFCQFWVPFLSLNHDQAVEIIELFFPLSYPSNIGWNGLWNGSFQFILKSVVKILPMSW